jgi:hypothetical protein
MSRLHGGLLLVLALLLAVAPATAQTQFAVNITDVAVEQLTNGLRITVKADGLLEAETTGSWYQTNEDHEFPVWLSNAHSSVGTFVDISRYPVNYLKLETPSDSREGVGVMLTVRLYRSAHVRSVDLDNQRTDWTWDWDPGNAAYDLRKGRSGRELVITVWSDRKELLPSEQKPRYEQGLEESLTVDFADGLLDVAAVNVPLETLMSEVALRSDVTITVSDRVQRLATLRLTGLPLDRFISAVANSLGLTVTTAEGAWFVFDGLPTALSAYTAADSREISLRHISADAALNLLPEFLVRYLRPSEREDAIVAYGPTNLLDRIEADVAMLDRPGHAVRITTAMVEVSGEDASEALWSLLRRTPTTVRLAPAEGRLRIEDSDGSLDDLVVRIQALETDVNLKVDVRPSLRVQQGQSARLFVGDRQFYQFLEDGYNLTLTSTEAGVSLLVSAGAIAEDAISAYVALDVSTFRGSRRPPIVDTREASANVILSNGGTLIVGGGIVESAKFRDRDSLYGIPGRKRDFDRCSEIVFLVGAEIITDESDAATRLPFGREI